MATKNTTTKSATPATTDAPATNGTRARNTKNTAPAPVEITLIGRGKHPTTGFDYTGKKRTVTVTDYDPKTGFGCTFTQSNGAVRTLRLGPDGRSAGDSGFDMAQADYGKTIAHFGGTEIKPPAARRGRPRKTQDTDANGAAPAANETKNANEDSTPANDAPTGKTGSSTTGKKVKKNKMGKGKSSKAEDNGAAPSKMKAKAKARRYTSRNDDGEYIGTTSIKHGTMEPDAAMLVHKIEPEDDTNVRMNVAPLLWEFVRREFTRLAKKDDAAKKFLAEWMVANRAGYVNLNLTRSQARYFVTTVVPHVTNAAPEKAASLAGGFKRACNRLVGLVEGKFPGGSGKSGRGTKPSAPAATAATTPEVVPAKRGPGRPRKTETAEAPAAPAKDASNNAKVKRSPEEKAARKAKKAAKLAKAAKANRA